MEVIVRERQGGKTNELIRRASECKGTIVTFDDSKVRGLMFEADRMGYTIKQPITFRKFCNKDYCVESHKEFLIDDVDVLLRYMSKVPISAIAVSIEKQEEK